MKSLIAGLSLSAALLSAAESDAPKRLQAAADVFKEIMDAPDKTIPQDLLNKARCVILVPGLKKAAFVVGAKYGRGFAMCRRENGGPMRNIVPYLEGVKINDRWVLLYSKYDIGCALEKHQSTDCLGHDHASALLLAKAAVLYALSH